MSSILCHVCLVIGYTNKNKICTLYIIIVLIYFVVTTYLISILLIFMSHRLTEFKLFWASFPTTLQQNILSAVDSKIYEMVDSEFEKTLIALAKMRINYRADLPSELQHRIVDSLEKRSFEKVHKRRIDAA